MGCLGVSPGTGALASVLLWAQESFAASKYAQPALRSFYQPLIRPCDISSKCDLFMEWGGKYTGYEFFFRYFLGTKYQVLDALRKSTSAGPQCLFLRTHAGIFDVSTCAGAWLFTALYV